MAIVPILSFLSLFLAARFGEAFQPGGIRRAGSKHCLGQRQTKGSQQNGPSHVSICARDLSRDETVKSKMNKERPVERLTRSGAPYPGSCTPHGNTSYLNVQSRGGRTLGGVGVPGSGWSLVSSVPREAGPLPTLASDDCLSGLSVLLCSSEAEKDKLGAELSFLSPRPLSLASLASLESFWRRVGSAMHPAFDFQESWF